MHIVLHRINGFPRMGRVGGGDSHQVKPLTLTLTLAPDHASPRPPELHQSSLQLASTHLYSSGWRDTL